MTTTAVARLCSVVIVAGVVAFLVLTALAAAAYSGGTYCEPDADRYRFWGNFFCDLTGAHTRRGIDNAQVAALANAGFLFFSLGLAPFFWLLGTLAPRFRRPTRIGGVTSAVATSIIAWTPSIKWPALHVATVFAATIPALVAAVLGVAGLLAPSREPDLGEGTRRRLLGTMGAVTLVTGFADALGYAYAVVVNAACLPWLPALQKVAAMSLLAWMGAVAISGWRRSLSNGE